MFYGDKVQDTRQLFFSSWEKFQHKKNLLQLEKQIVAVILDHPEYQVIFETPERTSDQAYFPEMGETNPFLHMGLHLAIRDQIHLDRPSGIVKIYQALVGQHHDRLSVEHLLMEQFAECLWQAQRAQCPPNESAYLQACRNLLG